MKGHWPRALVLLAAVTLATVASSPSFACVPQPFVLVRSQGSGVPGGTITVSGLRVGGAPVELRWGAIDGPLLATAQGPDFVTDVVIPPSLPGIYVVVVLSRNQDGSVGTVSAAPVQVAGSGTAPTQQTTRGDAAEVHRASRAGWLAASAVFGVGIVLVAAFACGRRRRPGTVVEEPVLSRTAGRP